MTSIEIFFQVAEGPNFLKLLKRSHNSTSKERVKVFNLIKNFFLKIIKINYRTVLNAVHCDILVALSYIRNIFYQTHHKKLRPSL